MKTNLVDEENAPLVAKPVHKVYALRWLMLALFGLSSATNAVLWITYSPISNHVENYYKINAFWVNMLSMVYMAAYIVVGFLASWCIDHVGLRFGITTGTVLTLIGAWVRVAGKYSYWYSMGGQLAAAIGQPFILNAVPKLAANWFPDDQRTLATTIASVINPIGVAIGFIIPPSFVHKPTDIPSMLFYQAILTSALSVPVLLLFRDKPPTPPSTAAASQRDEKFFSSLKSLAVDKNFWILLIAFSIGLGAFNTLATIMNEILQPYNYTNNETSIIGALVVVLGLVGAGLFGALVDKTRKYKIFLIISFLGATASMLAFSLFLKPNQFIYLSITSASLGFFTTPVLPLSLELVCEISYPIGEATPTGVLMIAGQISGIALIIGMQQFLNSTSSIIWCAYTTSICLGAGLLCVLLFNGKLKRLEHEQQQKYTINQTYS